MIEELLPKRCWINEFSKYDYIVICLSCILCSRNSFSKRFCDELDELSYHKFERMCELLYDQFYEHRKLSWSRKKTRYVTKSFVFMRITKKFLITILIFLAFASSGSYRNMKMTGSKESTVKVKLDLWFLSSLYWSLWELTQLAYDVVSTL